MARLLPDRVRQGLYGVYAFGAEPGRFDHVYASGHPDSGVYVGRCKPCHALVSDSVAERNHVGLEFPNASGGTVVRESVARRNRVGIQVNALNKERDAPRASEGFGAGIVINGGRGNTVRGNVVSGHAAVGIVVLDSPDFTAERNRVERNRLRANRLDLALRTDSGRSVENCFTRNRPATTSPADLERRTECAGSAPVPPGRLPRLRVPPQVDYRTVPASPPQPNMPHARMAPAEPATGTPEELP